MGGLAALSRLRGAARGGLTLNEAAEAQRTGFPQLTVKMMRNGEEVRIYQKAGLKGRCKFRGRDDLLRPIDLQHVGPDGRTNLARMKEGLAPLDPSDVSYELHHIGQRADSPLAVLTQQEHRGPGNDLILHDKSLPSEVDHGNEWLKTKRDFWTELAAQAGLGLLDVCLA